MMSGGMRDPEEERPSNLACLGGESLPQMLTACVPAVQAQRRSKEHSRSTSALSGVGDEKSEVSQDPDQHMSLYSNGFMTSSMGKEPQSNRPD